MNVSVVVPTHNRSAALAETLASLLVQTRPPAEVLIIDDGPCPQPPEGIERLRCRGITCAYLHRQPPSLPASRNLGARLARGDVVLMLDDDECLDSDYLQRLGELFELDGQAAVDGIAGRRSEPRPDLGAKLWAVASGLLGLGRWMPRRRKARLADLPADLRGRLKPLDRVSGGTLALRAKAAMDVHVPELPGYALAEDVAYTFLAVPRLALYQAEELRMEHRPGPAGRGSMRERGRTYVSHTTSILRCWGEPGPGQALLLGMDFCGQAVLHGLWGLARPGSGNLAFLVGLLEGLARLGRQWSRRELTAAPMECPWPCA